MAEELKKQNGTEAVESAGNSQPSEMERLAKKAEEDLKAHKKKMRKRAVIAAAVFGSLFIIALVILLVNLANDTGWREVTVRPGSEKNCASSFKFQMKLDRSAGGVDYHTLTEAYTQATIKAYDLFDTEEAHPGVSGIYEVNRSVGQTVTVEPELYKAFEILEKSGFRGLYLAPVYAVYQELFLSEDDSFAALYDPNQSDETAAYFEKLCSFISDPEAISLKLLGENAVRLEVSDAYLSFAKENEITVFLDFFWMKNAFILDYLTDELLKTGYASGYLQSNDGYVSVLDRSGTSYDLPLYVREDLKVYPWATFQCTGPFKMVSFHDYTTDYSYEDYYYAYRDNVFVTPYVDPEDGYCKNSIHDLWFYTETGSAAEMLLIGAKLMITAPFSSEEALSYAEDGLYAVFIIDREIYDSGHLLSDQLLRSGAAPSGN